MACPANTNSSAGSASQLGCRCSASYACSYKKLITAVVTLNTTTVSDFNSNANGVRTRFIASVAAAAGVSTMQVTIVSVQMHLGRRLLTERMQVIDVYTHIEGATRLTRVSHHMARRGMLVENTEWSVEHTVRASFILPPL
jgi:hypothetical protein